MPNDEAWYWDLGKGCAVPAAARGKGHDVLGPYPTREAAENWRSTVEARNEDWADQDDDWNDQDDEDDED